MPFTLATNLIIEQQLPIDSRLTTSDISADTSTYFYTGLVKYQTADVTGGLQEGLYVYNSANSWTAVGGAVSEAAWNGLLGSSATQSACRSALGLDNSATQGYGTTATTKCVGNDYRLSDSRNWNGSVCDDSAAGRSALGLGDAALLTVTPPAGFIASTYVVNVDYLSTALTQHTANHVQPLTSSVAALTTRVTSNETEVATNTGNISTLTSGLATAVGDIATNTSGLNSAVSDIATNTSGLAAAVSNIATNTSGLAAAVSDIATNTSGLSSLTATVGTNTSAISSNTSNIAANTSNVATNTAAISSITSDIAAAEATLVSAIAAANALTLKVNQNETALLGKQATITNSMDLSARSITFNNTQSTGNVILAGNAILKSGSSGAIIQNGNIINFTSIQNSLLTNATLGASWKYQNTAAYNVVNELNNNILERIDPTSGQHNWYKAGDIATVLAWQPQNDRLFLTGDVLAHKFLHRVSGTVVRGYAFLRFQGISGTINMNTTAGIDIPWINVHVDGQTFQLDGTTRVKIVTTGYYEVGFNVYLTSTVQRANPTIRIRVNGTDSGYLAWSYIRSASDHNESSWSLSPVLMNLVANDLITVQGRFTSNGIAGGCYLYNNASSTNRAYSTLTLKRVA